MPFLLTRFVDVFEKVRVCVSMYVLEKKQFESSFQIHALLCGHCDTEQGKKNYVFAPPPRYPLDNFQKTPCTRPTVKDL